MSRRLHYRDVTSLRSITDPLAPAARGSFFYPDTCVSLGANAGTETETAWAGRGGIGVAKSPSG